jgi:ergothioneine biosynthesis protein EgtB
MHSVDSNLTEPFLSIRRRSLQLCESLEYDDFLVQSADFVSPPKWHLGHTTWFFENFVLTPQDPAYRVLDPTFGFLFNSYYKTVGEHVLKVNRGVLSRPTLERVFEYRQYVDEHLRRLLDKGVEPALRATTVLGMQHEQQHQELMCMDIKHILYQNPHRPAGPFPATAQLLTGSAAFIEMHGGLVSIGHAGDGFCFDNELPRHTVFLQPYQLCNRPVTNGEYLQFIDDGGYRNPALWLSDGWDTACAQNWQAPLYWERDSDGWKHYTPNGMMPLVLDAPVQHTSGYEADAFARWTGARLPTEAEWEWAMETQGSGFEWGQVWEWTRSAYAAYPGYRVPAGSIGEYNSKFMSNQWVLRGGSVATPPGHTRLTYRNFYPPQMRWQFGGIRLAKDIG